jgi:uncharacterized protein (TIRG00374 family)
MVRPLTKHPGLLRILSATCIGFTAVVLFGRAGEPVRPYLIARKEGVSFSSQIAAWLVERILDLLMVIVIFGIALTQVGESAVQPGPRMKTVIEAGGFTAGIAGLICLALILALQQFRGEVHHRVLQALSFLPDSVLYRLQRFLAAFEEGMQSVRNPGSVWLLIGYTIVEWSVLAGSFYCVFKAFPATAGMRLTDVVIALGFVAFGSVLQIPGVGGGMQLAAILVLTELYGLNLEAATGVSLMLWLISFVGIVPIGLGLAFLEGIKFRNLRNLKASASGYSV